MVSLVRLGSRSSNEFIQNLNRKNEEIQQAFLTKMKSLTNMIEVKVMLGDSTVTTQKTFDPAMVSDFFKNILQNLKDWSVQDVSISKQ